MDRNQQIAHALRRQGIECTPDQAGEDFEGAIRNIRRGMAKRGHDLSDLTDDEVGYLAHQSEMKERFDRRLEGLIDQIRADAPPRPWHVIGPQGESLARFEKTVSAAADCAQRAARGRSMGVFADYRIAHIPEGV